METEKTHSSFISLTEQGNEGCCEDFNTMGQNCTCLLIQKDQVIIR